MPQAEKYLKILLWLIALHSFVVAMLLIFLGEEGMQYFGFSSGNSFFQVQGGVFHVVMCTAYLLAARKPSNNKGLILFIITAKLIAMLYLLIYYFCCEAVITVLLSGIGDGLMGLLLMLLWLKMHAKTKEDAHG
ncbi:MAG: hypothetical protein ABFS05_13465 [Bacteroidota bacterium]